MRIVKYFWLLALSVTLFCSCQEDDSLLPSDEALFPQMEDTPISLKLKEMFGRFNTRVEYRYIQNLIPEDWYYIVPAQEDLVLPVAKVFLDMWIGSLIAGSDTTFVEQHFPRMILLVGSPAYQLDGTVVLGQAEGGTLIRFTEINKYKPGNRDWIERQLNTAFHEYAHLLHQTFNMPDDYREVTPNNYTQNGWQPLTNNQAIMRGMVTPYGTSSVQEDYAELFATYVMKDDALLDVLVRGKPITLNKEGWDEMTDEQKESALLQKSQMEAGCQLIAKKFAILKKHLGSAGLDIDKVRTAFQAQLNAIN